jgi:hypothetical protein
LNVASASTIASNDFFTAAGKSSASMFCHFNSSFAIAVGPLNFIRERQNVLKMSDQLATFSALFIAFCHAPAVGFVEPVRAIPPVRVL